MKLLERSGGLRGRNVLKTRDVEEGAFHQSFRDGMAVKINSDEDGVSFDEHHVMVGDVVSFAVRHADAERLKWPHLHAFLELQCSYHVLSLGCFIRFDKSEKFWQLTN